jgi:hypothetical protein
MDFIKESVVVTANIRRETFLWENYKLNFLVADTV